MEILAYIIGFIIGGFIWGAIVQATIERKNIEEDWFWWGFFFGPIAFLVASTQPQNDTYNYMDSDFLTKKKDAYKTETKAANGFSHWECKKCGRINYPYVGTCACGATNTVKILAKKELTSNTTPNNKFAFSPADEIAKYKRLLDEGAITEEEYNAKKKKLLDL